MAEAKKKVTVPKTAPKPPKSKVPRETLKEETKVKTDPSEVYLTALDAALALQNRVPADANLQARFLVLESAVESVKQGIASHQRRLSRA